MDMETVANKVSEFTGVPAKEIRSGNSDRGVCKSRRIFMYLSYKIYGIPQTEIASFTNRSRQFVSNQIIAMDQDLRLYRGLSKTVLEIKESLIGDENAPKPHLSLLSRH